MDPAIVAAGFIYEAFQGTFIIAVGSGIIVFVTGLFARLLWDRRYWDCTRVYAKASSVLFLASAAFFVAAMVLANNTAPVPEMVLPFVFSLWGAPLALALAFMLVSAFLMFLEYRLQRPFSTPSSSSAGVTSLLTFLGALSALVSLLFYNLVNSYMVSPEVPSGLQAVVQAGSIDPLTQLGLMLNRSYFPLTVKIILIGSLTFSALFSGAAAVRRLRLASSDGESAWLDFMTSWGFKTSILFGAPIGVIGYWYAAILHTSVPSLALGLMGVVSEGLSSALVVGLSPLWDIGIALSMSLGAVAGVYYLSKGHGKIRINSSEQRMLKMSMPWLIILLAIGTLGVLYVGEWYPQQFVLSLAILLDGVLIFEAVRLYCLAQLRLYVPALWFVLSCYGLIVYQAPHTNWYQAANFGGVSWPLIGFPLLAVTTYYFTTRWAETKYWIPIAVGFIALLIVTVKTADVELVKGQTVVALDPTVKSVVQNWAFLNGYDINTIYKTYPVPSNDELFSALAMAYAVFLGVYYWITRAVRHPRLALAGPGGRRT